MKIAFVGTGFVADYYALTLTNHPELELVAAHDVNSDRLAQFCTFHRVRPRSLDEILADPDIRLIVNLTPPQHHDSVNRAALSAGKHVYCEKPMAMDLEAGTAIINLARERGLSLAGAPANALSDAAEITEAAIGSGRIGAPRLVLAEMDDGPVFSQNWQSWRSMSGAAWPGVHEFETGCTLEHAGYGLSWLIRLFGPVRHVAATAGLAHPDKGPETKGHSLANDFSIGCLTFDQGVVARLTNGLAAPRNRSMTIVGETGSLLIDDLWNNRSAVRHVDWTSKPPLAYRLARKLEHRLGKVLQIAALEGRVLPYQGRGARHLPAFPSQIDFARGIMAQVQRIKAGDVSTHHAELALHIAEVSLALHEGLPDYRPRALQADQPAS